MLPAPPREELLRDWTLRSVPFVRLAPRMAVDQTQVANLFIDNLLYSTVD